MNKDNYINYLDSYSILICSKYFKNEQDFINIMCVNSKFKETTEKLRFNPIPIKSLKLFPKLETQYLYDENDKKLNGINKYEIWYEVDYNQYSKYKEDNIKFHSIKYTLENRKQYGDVIPTEVNTLGLFCYGSKSFNNIGSSNIKEIHIPTTIKKIQYGCFHYCSLLQLINLPSTITSLGDYCFWSCKSLTSINLPSTITSLGERCFCGCESLQSINLPSSILSLGNYCFISCSSLQSINLPSSILSLGDCCFYGCSSLQLINLPSTMTYLGERCFDNCLSLTSITLLSSLTSLKNKMNFKNCHPFLVIINDPE